MEFNVYIDGTWLFTQCGAGLIFANRMEFPENRFRLDFSRLLELLAEGLGHRLEAAGVDHKPPTPGSLYFYTAIFEIPAEPDPEWGDIDDIRPRSEARRRFADDAVAAGFSEEGIFTVPLRGWIVQRLRERRYQEKMVDTSLVARLVEQAIVYPQRLHVLITGDLDMLPAIRTVVPDYTETVVLATTHPDQYIRAEAQSSFRLNQFEFRHDPVYLEQRVEQLLSGEHIYRCSNPRCNRIFVRPRPIPGGSNPVCKPCNDARLEARARLGARQP
jgi:hypothetical protein